MARKPRPTRAQASPKERPVIPDETLRRLIFRTFGHHRFTQDSPILPDVWLAYAKADKDISIDLILTPKAGHAPGTIARELEKRLTYYSQTDRSTPALPPQVAYSRSSVVARLTFKQLMRVVVPMTTWWRGLPEKYQSYSTAGGDLGALENSDVAFRDVIKTTEGWEYYRFILLAGFVDGWREFEDPEDVAELLQTDRSDFGKVDDILINYLRLLRSFKPIPDDDQGSSQVWNISLNRRTEISLFESRQAIKADAAQNVFQISTRDLTWAVIDCGVDAQHPAFMNRAGSYPAPEKGADIDLETSRVIRSLDFTFLRSLLADDEPTFLAGTGSRLAAAARTELKDLRRRISLGREIDWELILPLLEIKHHNKQYRKPNHDHGTHVAGILAGTGRRARTTRGRISRGFVRT